MSLPGLDAARVSAWMVDNVAGAVGPMTFAVISGGHSNLTYKATDAAGRRYVVRRPPLTAGAAKAHDVSREHRVIAALGPTDVPVPPALALCTDESVNGAPFYVMGLVDAHVVDNPPEVERCLPDPAARRHASHQIVDVLADLHRVDVDAVGLGEAARREDFLERQLARYVKVWAQNQTRELPMVDELHARLVAHRPAQRHTGIVHSDYRFGNVMLSGDGTLAAVLDWELWTLGDVLADVGFLLNNWHEPGDTDPNIWMEVPPTMAGGFASRVEVARRYAERTGHDLSAIEYYRAFQYWKVAVLAEGVKRRYETGALVSVEVDFDHMARRVIDLVELSDQHLTAHQEGSP